jgi:hypothetical protein
MPRNVDPDTVAGLLRAHCLDASHIEVGIERLGDSSSELAMHDHECHTLPAGDCTYSKNT